MKFLIIGLGSMGSRRIRCLKALGYNDIYGYDKYTTNKEIKMFDEEEYGTLETFIENIEPDAIIVCVPPLQKQRYIDLANDFSIPVFIETDITTYKGEYYPSATMRFHKAIIEIKKLLKDLGRVYTFNYVLGQHLRDWHIGADYTNYYAAQKETSACKEMLVFELSWLSWLFGKPINAVGMIDKQLNDKEISADDVYASVIQFDKSSFICGENHSDSIIGTLLIDVVTRPAIRELRIVGENGTLLWNWEDDHILFMQNDTAEGYYIGKDSAFEGYNENIPEQMYTNETNNFILSLKGVEQYKYSQEEDENIVDILKKVENG